MTETSDFAETQGGSGPAPLPEMQATAAWQAAWGVTDFNLYYGLAVRPIAQYRAYCDYVGRLNAILKPAQGAAKTLLYYPIYDLWAEYLPTAEPLRLESQSPRAQRIVGSFMRLGETLQRSQVPFVLVDHENLARATARADGGLVLAGRRYEALVLPDGVELPAQAAQVVERGRREGLRVLAGPWDETSLSARSLVERLHPDYRISPASATVCLGQFVRDGRAIVVAVNVGRQPYAGELAPAIAHAGPWQQLDPAGGSIRPAPNDASGRIRLSLAPRQVVLLVSGP